MVFERLFFTLVLIALGVSAFWIYQRRLRTHRIQQRLLEIGFQPDRIEILYFTAPDCIPCENYQKPILSELRSAYPDRLNVYELDATVHTEIADEWGVLSVPTMFPLDEEGSPHKINNGPTSKERLVAQLRDIWMA
jgi:thiol-disulfide isomerase/thioredoxin